MPPEKMRAVVIHKHGGLEALSLESTWPRPVAGLGEIVVRVEACSLNYLDIFVRQGMPGEPIALPTISGGDIAGIVHEVGTGVKTPKIGTRVVINPNWGCGQCDYCYAGLALACIRPHLLGEGDPGGLAEFVKCPATQAILVPDHYSLENAACLPVAFGTAFRMVATRAQAKAGDVVLVLGAGGGVAVASIQIAKLMGARVIATASTDEKIKRARALGADEVINYTKDKQWDITVRRITNKRGADIVIDSIGAGTWPQSIRALGKLGRLVTCGATAGPVAETDIRYLFRREHNILGSNGWTHDDLRRVTQLAFDGKLVPIIDRVLPLKKIAEAEALLERREVFGKIVIRPGE